jgi:hypothetical protein
MTCPPYQRANVNCYRQLILCLLEGTLQQDELGLCTLADIDRAQDIKPTGQIAKGGCAVAGDFVTAEEAERFGPIQTPTALPKRGDSLPKSCARGGYRVELNNLIGARAKKPRSLGRGLSKDGGLINAQYLHYRGGVGTIQVNFP